MLAMENGLIDQAEITDLLCIQCHAQQGRYEHNWNFLHFDKILCITLKWWLSENDMKAPKYARDIHAGTYPMVTEPIYWPQCKRGTQHFSGSRGEGGGGVRGMKENASLSNPMLWSSARVNQLALRKMTSERCYNISKSTSLRNHMKGFWIIFWKTGVQSINGCLALQLPRPPPLHEIQEHSPSRKHHRGESLWAESALGKEVSWSWKETHTSYGSIWTTWGASLTLYSATSPMSKSRASIL